MSGPEIIGGAPKAQKIVLLRECRNTLEGNNDPERAFFVVKCANTMQFVANSYLSEKALEPVIGLSDWIIEIA